MYSGKLDDDFSWMTEAEYLAFADTQEFKYEYQNGEIVAMTGGSVWHGVITGNTITHLNNQLGERDCTVTSPDVRVHIAAKRAYHCPDVTLFCGDPAYMEGRTDTITNPALLVEVLSPGTAKTDHTDKLAEYTQIDTLQVYVLISQDEPRVEVYRRQTAQQWLYTYATGLDAEIDVRIDAVPMTLSLAQIYRRVRWDEDDPQSESDGDGSGSVQNTDTDMV